MVHILVESEEGERRWRWKGEESGRWMDVSQRRCDINNVA